MHIVSLLTKSPDTSKKVLCQRRTTVGQALTLVREIQISYQENTQEKGSVIMFKSNGKHKYAFGYSRHIANTKESHFKTMKNINDYHVA